MQAGKKTTRNSSKGRYMDIIRPAQKTNKTNRTVKRPAIIEATHVTTEIYDPEIDDVETIDELEYGVVGTPKPQSAPAAPKKPRQLVKEYPFITSVNVDKRPLSPYVPKNGAASSRPVKNVYSTPAKPLKKVKKSTTKPEKKKSAKVVETPKKSGLSLAIIILITVILGAAAGVGAYLLLPH